MAELLTKTLRSVDLQGSAELLGQVLASKLGAMKLQGLRISLLVGVSVTACSGSVRLAFRLAATGGHFGGAVVELHSLSRAVAHGAEGAVALGEGRVGGVADDDRVFTSPVRLQLFNQDPAGALGRAGVADEPGQDHHSAAGPGEFLAAPPQGELTGPDEQVAEHAKGFDAKGPEDDQDHRAGGDQPRHRGSQFHQQHAHDGEQQLSDEQDEPEPSDRRDRYGSATTAGQGQ